MRSWRDCRLAWLVLGMLLACGSAAAATPRSLPEAAVVDQDGRHLQFYRDVAKDKTVVINFVFTTCTMICPTQAATLREVQRSLGERVGRDVALVSISIDPATDVPERLKAFARRFEAGPGWHFLTGRKPDIDALTAKLGAAGASPSEHSGLILVVNEAGGSWQRLEGLASAPQIVHAVEQAAGAAARAAAARYFPDLPLLTQEGKPVRFYSDVLKDKVVLINFMYTSCPGICSPMTANLARVQALLGERSGRDVQMVSITVDPGTDTPAVLKEFARQFEVKPGWTFLTGSKVNLDWVRYRLGGYSGEEISDHSTVLLAGNLNTGEWKKLMALAAPREIVAAIAPLITPAR